MFAGCVEHQLGPAFLGQAQVDARGGQVGHVAGRVVGDVVAERVLEVRVERGITRAQALTWLENRGIRMDIDKERI